MHKIALNKDYTKQVTLALITNHITSLGLTIIDQDIAKPWGAYFVIDEKDIDRFVDEYFSDISINKTGKLTPKILVVGPKEILSWQYHHRRAEVWRVVAGPVDVMQSENDTQTAPVKKNAGDLVSHGPLIRHRLIGAGAWGVVAEIWQHTNPNNPSTEEDIVRVEDVYGR